ncbi:unnamed protein product [Caenorhabditis brenneri]
MKQSSKYSLNGVYRCENFAQYVENDDFPEFPIGSALGLDGWYIKFRISDEGFRTWVYPFIYHHNHPKIQVRSYFKVLRDYGSSSFEKESKFVCLEPREGCIGKYMDIDLLLDEGFGYLDDGALTVEYGLQVNSEEGKFNWEKQDNMFDFIIRHESSLFGHKEIIQLHSKKISDLHKDWVGVPKSITVEDLVMCLQITHGVRLQMTAKGFQRTMKIAFYFGFFNTARYCEQILIEMDEQPKLKLSKKFKLAVKFKLERYLNHLVKQIKSPERLMSILKKLNIEKMTSESMKTFVGKWLFE